ncbi:MAG TPA: FHA domain-containing protein [Myxococcota bacterium]|nr:FHA domain-containing protein [Myxococcota bacterium]
MGSERGKTGAGPPHGAVATVLSGFYEGLEVAIDRARIVIGRGRKADLALAEATISRAHAAIGFDAEGFFVEDLGSTNGTMVNGARITRQRLKSEDEIVMGKLRIGVSLPA